jgi:glycosyltransferase involved in cell wall biosynthesis
VQPAFPLQVDVFVSELSLKPFLKVIHIITGLNQGGAEAMLEKLLLTGRRLNPEIEQSVINLGTPGVVAARLMRAGVHVESLGLRFSPQSLKQLFRLIRQLRVDRFNTVVQTWLWHADLLGGLCARASGNRRIVWNLRNSMPNFAGTKLRSRAVARLCALLSRWVPAKIVCNSQAALRTHVTMGYRVDKCVVIPNGFDLRVFVPSVEARREVRERWGTKSDELVVGMVARLDPTKDHATFIRAAVDVVTAIPSVRFVLVGEGVTTDVGIRRLLAETRLTDRFVLEERRDDVQRVMSALDVFCLASKSEGFPNVLGEAMACATPAITTDVGDGREIVADKRLVAAVGDPARLAECIMRVLRLSREERWSWGLSLRRTVEARFDIERVWDMYRRLYCSA